MNGTNGFSVHLRGEKIGDWKMGKYICCCKLERLNSFEDLIRFQMHDMKEKEEFYEALESYGAPMTSCVEIRFLQWVSYRTLCHVSCYNMIK